MGGQDGCERRIEVFVKIYLFIFSFFFLFFLGGGGRVKGWVGFGGQGRFKQRSEFFVKIQKQNGGCHFGEGGRGRFFLGGGGSGWM